MLDRKFIQQHPDRVEAALREKGISFDLKAFLNDLEEQRSLKIQLEELNAERNTLSKGGKPADPERARAVKDKHREVKLAFDRLDENIRANELRIPNLPWDGAPKGQDASANRVIREVGKPKHFSFPPKNHIELGQALQLLDLERGAQTSGFRGYYLKNEAVLLQLGLLSLAVQRLQRAGFSLMVPPALVREFALIGSGHLPFGRDEVYQLTTTKHENDGLQFLAGTSEPSLLAYYANTTLDASQLPIRLCGISPCFRSEIGSYGKDTKGLYRVHEFMKVEQVVLSAPNLEGSNALFDEMLGHAESLLNDLELPYRLIETSTGDMGAGKYRMVDIETWMPGRNGYGETHSNSHLTDWQARRLAIRTRGGESAQETAFVHTLNNTMIASPRILIAILENYQRADGTIDVPHLLQPFVGKKRISGAA